MRTEGRIRSDSVTERTGGVSAHLFGEGQRKDIKDLSKVRELIRDDKNLVWIDLSEYAPKDLEDLGPLLQLDPLTVEATLGDWERPRVDVFPAYFYMTTTVLQTDTGARTLEARELNIVSGRNFVLTAHKLPLPFGDEVLDRLTQSPEVATLHTAYVVYILIDELIEYFEGLFEHVEDEIEKTEERALTESSDEFLADLLVLKRHIFAFGRLVEQHGGVFSV